MDEVYVYIRSLRQKLEFNSKSPQMIRSKYRKGYVLITKNILKEFSVS
ncbi:winged helix-turn-helix domain-containing protein [Alicyclobacillus hesperidum]